MITSRSAFFLAALAVFVAGLLVVGAYYSLRVRSRRKYPYGKWDDILRRFTQVDRDNIALIALDFIDESGRRRPTNPDTDLDPEQIWPLIGGMQGLAALEHNCDVLIDLVFYVQQWYPEALAITEQLRPNAREIKWHISQLKGAEKTGRLKEAFPDYAQRAVVTYYLMTRRVLAVYEQANLPQLASLQGAL